MPSDWSPAFEGYPLALEDSAMQRPLAELFFVTENRVTELGSLQEYLLALNTEDHLHRCTAQALKNIAAISLAINYPNKSTSFWNV